MSSYHITSDGPKRCIANIKCPVGGEHFANKSDANSSYLEMLAQQNSSFPPKPGEVDLPCAFGAMRVKDGDLSDLKSRTALISGLCGSLALAVHDKTGGTPYFVCYGDNAGGLKSKFDEDKETLFDYATHALVESTTRPGYFIDAYGQKSLEDIKTFYGDSISLERGTRDMLVAYGVAGADEVLGGFAKAAIELDSKSEGYDYLDFGDLKENLNKS